MALQVALDMDQVLAAFNQQVREQWGLDCPEDWDGITREVDLAIRQKLSDDPAFFETLKPMPGVEALYAFAKRIGPVKVITSLPGGWKKHEERSKKAAVAKLNWMRSTFDFQGEFFCVESGTKHLYRNTNPGVVEVLVDDLPSNIQGWIQSGGVGILHTSVEGSIASLRALHLLGI